MPELPEVETTCQGIAPHILGQKVLDVIVREKKLRWPVPAGLSKLLKNNGVIEVSRRAKYLLITFNQGVIMIHLGMSGSLRIVATGVPAEKHDHLDFKFQNGNVLRYRDPRKFGSIHWITGPLEDHPLLCALGPEPLTDEFSGSTLHTRSRKRKIAVKAFIMDSHVVVGVGNIYANEALFRAGIRPTLAAGKVSLARYEKLASAIKEILEEAIRVGGTTLRDFLGSDGEPGYFKQSLVVYGRGGEPCLVCKSVLKEVRLGQRSTVYCSNCQR
jgi:formamidopyrimidine-DNA glycosylase